VQRRKDRASSRLAGHGDVSDYLDSFPRRINYTYRKYPGWMSTTATTSDGLICLGNVGPRMLNGGNFANEIDVPALAQLASELREARRHITEYVLRDGRRLYLLVQGIAASDGHPVEILDMSFSVQVLAIHLLANHAGELTPGLHPLPEEIDREIASTRLRLLGVQLEEMTGEQKAYLQSWRSND